MNPQPIVGEDLKVLWVTPTMGSDFGGPSTTVVNGLIAENEAGIKSELLTTIGRGDAPSSIKATERLAEQGVTVRLFPRINLIGRSEAWGLSPHLVFWLIRNIRKYDLLHLQYVWCLTSIVGVLAARMAGIPTVVTPHESLTRFDIEVASRHSAIKLLKRTLRYLFFACANQLILMSRLEARDTQSRSVPVEVIPHAVVGQSVSRNEQQRGTDRALEIAFLGRNVEKKGLHLILRAIAMRRDRNRSMRIAGPRGTDEFQREIDDLIERLDIGERVEWVGYVPDRDSYLSSADVLAMPSAYEGFGMVSAEAMSLGIPVVVTAATGVSEIVEEYRAGIVMADASVEELDRALMILEDGPDLRVEMGINGVRAVNERLNFETFARRTGAVYRETVYRYRGISPPDSMPAVTAPSVRK